MKKYGIPAVILIACVALLFFFGQHLEGDAGARQPAGTKPAAGTTAMAADGIHPQLIAHAGGAVYGYRLTNSLEALDQAVASGFHYIELDFSTTSDGHIVLIHDWEGTAQRLLGSAGQRTLEGFTSAETMAGLTLPTLDQLLAWLADHPDCTIITDTKDADNVGLLEALKAQAGEQAGAFLPQAYSYEEYQRIRELGFENVILTLYKMHSDQAALTDFVQTSRPWAITLPEERLEQTLVTALAQAGAVVYTHTIDSVDTFDQWSAMGLTGIYTDYFQPARWLYG